MASDEAEWEERTLLLAIYRQNEMILNRLRQQGAMMGELEDATAAMGAEVQQVVDSIGGNQSTLQAALDKANADLAAMTSLDAADKQALQDSLDAAHNAAVALTADTAQLATVLPAAPAPTPAPVDTTTAPPTDTTAVTDTPVTPTTDGGGAIPGGDATTTP